MISRLAQRTAIAAMLTGVAGLDTVYTYELHPDDPNLMGTTYATIDILEGNEHRLGGGAGPPYKQQDRTWVIHLTKRSQPFDPLRQPALRGSLEAEFDVVKDSVEQTIRLNSKLMAQGAYVIHKFGEEFATVEGVSEFSSARAIQEAYIAVKGYLVHQ